MPGAIGHTMQPTYTQYQRRSTMQEHKKAELTLMIRDGGLDMHLNEPLGELSQRVLRSLALGEPPPVDAVFTEAYRRCCGCVDRCSTCPFTPAEHDVNVAKQAKAAAQPDDEALEDAEWRLQEGIRQSWAKIPPGRDAMRAEAVLAHLRAHGFMRTQGGDKDAECVDERSRWQTELKSQRDILQAQLAESAQRLESLGHNARHQRERADVAQAQVRTLTAKAEEGIAHLELAGKHLRDEQARTGRLQQEITASERRADDEHRRALAAEAAAEKLGEQLAASERNVEIGVGMLADTQAQLNEARADLAAAEMRAHDSGQEAVRIGTALLDARKALAMKREMLEAARARIAAMEKQQVERLQAHEAHRG